MFSIIILIITSFCTQLHGMEELTIKDRNYGEKKLNAMKIFNEACWYETLLEDIQKIYKNSKTETEGFMRVKKHLDDNSRQYERSAQMFRRNSTSELLATKSFKESQKPVKPINSSPDNRQSKKLLAQMQYDRKLSNIHTVECRKYQYFLSKAESFQKEAKDFKHVKNQIYAYCYKKIIYLSIESGNAFYELISSKCNDFDKIFKHSTTALKKAFQALLLLNSLKKPSSKISSKNKLLLSFCQLAHKIQMQEVHLDKLLNFNQNAIALQIKAQINHQDQIQLYKKLLETSLEQKHFESAFVAITSLLRIKGQTALYINPDDENWCKYCKLAHELYPNKKES